MIMPPRSRSGYVCRIPGSEACHSTVLDTRNKVSEVVVAVEDPTTDEVIRCFLRSPGTDPAGDPVFIIPPERSPVEFRLKNGRYTIVRVSLQYTT